MFKLFEFYGKSSNKHVCSHEIDGFDGRKRYLQALGCKWPVSLLRLVDFLSVGVLAASAVLAAASAVWAAASAGFAAAGAFLSRAF